MSKTKSDVETRLRVLELAIEIASEAAQNTNIVWMIEFQEELVERLHRKMMVLLEEDASDERDEKEDEDEVDEVKERRSKKKKKEVRSAEPTSAIV
jgi:hypothetical protein